MAASTALAASRAQMPGNGATLRGVAAWAAGLAFTALRGVAGGAAAGNGAWQLKQWLWEAGFCQLHLGHCMVQVLFWLSM
ncbi:hypothetical protein DDE05_31210 [Streptomyces cavourensis]|nr:hypothetical protein DDE05_31210 [Streptomyces cavourensis]